MLRVLLHRFCDLLFYSLDLVLETSHELFEFLPSLRRFWLRYLFSLSFLHLLVLHMASHLGGDTWDWHKRLGSTWAFLVIEELWTPNEKDWQYSGAGFALLFLNLPQKFLDTFRALAARWCMVRLIFIFLYGRFFCFRFFMKRFNPWWFFSLGFSCFFCLLPLKTSFLCLLGLFKDYLWSLSLAPSQRLGHCSCHRCRPMRPSLFFATR